MRLFITMNGGPLFFFLEYEAENLEENTPIPIRFLVVKNSGKHFITYLEIDFTSFISKSHFQNNF